MAADSQPSDSLARHLRLFHPEENSSLGRTTNEQSFLHQSRRAESTNCPVLENTGALKSLPAVTDHLLPPSATPTLNAEPIRDPESGFGGDYVALGAEPIDQSDPWLMNDDLNFFWNDEWSFPEVLPANFFDPNVSLADISHQYCQNRPGQQTNDQGVAQGHHATQGSASNSSGTLDLLSGNAGNDGPHNFIAENEIDPYQNFRLEGNVNPSVSPWKISNVDYEEISREMAKLSSILPTKFSLPSRHTLSRFLEGYFRGFHEHMPFLHTPSCSALSLGLELILSLAAVGALYRFEHTKGYRLYQAARMLINWGLDQRNEHALHTVTSNSSDYSSPTKVQGQELHDTASSKIRGHSFISPSSHKLDLRLLQGLTVLMAMSTWGDQAVVQGPLAMSGQVALLAREIGISMPDASHDSKSWERWVDEEERRRTLYAAYILFNLQCIAFNVPPMILNREVCLILPACGAEWTAPNAQEWKRMRELHVPSSRPFQQVLGQLTQGNQFHKPDAVSSFANYVLMHGLVQEIFFTRNTTSLMESNGSLQRVFVQTMETALRAWQQSWEATYESTLDPLSPRGPMGFNATALLRLAYIRLNANMGSHRQFSSWNPVDIAHGFVDGKTTVYDRSPHLDRAVLQCIHALSVPVRLGIPFIARTQTLSWSIQHSLCHLECAFLLNHWLETIAQSIEVAGIQTIREDERSLLKLIHSVIREADLMEIPDLILGDAMAVRRLAVCSVRLWTETFKGAHVFEISKVIGESLAIISDMLASQLES